eukprot:g7369.t2
MAAPRNTVAARAGAALSYAREVLPTAAMLFQEMPVTLELCVTYLVFEELVETSKSNKEYLAVLRELYDVVIKGFLRERCLVYSAGNEEALLRLKQLVEKARMVAQLCNGRVKQIVLARKISRDIAAARKNVLDFAVSMNVSLANDLSAKLDVMAVRLADQEKYKPPGAHVAGAPVIREWYVERENLISNTCDRLGVGSSANRSEESRIVGLAGPSGAGKTIAAAMVISQRDVRAYFPNGVLWLSVGRAGKNRLSAVMSHLAENVYETVMVKACRPPRKADVLVNAEDGAAYIREVLDEGSRRVLVVADDVWEEEVLRELEKAGVWVLYTTRMADLLPEDRPLRVDQVRRDEAEMILRGAASLVDPTEGPLPEAAYELMSRCEYSALDLALVGRWSELRGRNDERPWRTALGRILESQEEGGGGPGLPWRAAVLRAGLEELATDNAQNKELYLALAILPNGMAFPLEVGASLLYGSDFSAQDMESAEHVLQTLERWSVVTLAENGAYRVDDNHLDFAWECLLANRYTLNRVLPRWRKYISSVEALNTYSSGWLVKIWDVLAKVEGGRVVPSPYDKVLSATDLLDPELPKALKKVAEFHYERQDWPDAYDKYSRLRVIEEDASGKNSLHVANILHNLGMCANEMVGREKETERLLRRALEIQKEKLGPDDQDVANTLHALGVCVREAGKTAEAEQLLRQALAIRKEKSGDPLSLARIQYSLGVVAYKTGRLQEAEEELLQEALTTRIKWLGQDHPEVANALYYLGLCEHKAGRTGEGEKKLHRALEIFEQKMGSDHQDVADTLFALGNCALEAEGRTSEAKDYFWRALVIREKQATNRVKKVADTLHALGVCASEAGQPGEAEDLFRRVNALLKEQSTAFRYEASVDGGNIEGNGIRKSYGSMDATSDFLLSKMDSESYGEVLKEALDVGHAEEDLRQLLAELVVDATVSPGSIQCRGVFSSLTTEDFEYAKILHWTIKLRGTAKLSPGGDTLSVFVSPVLILPPHPVDPAEDRGSVVSVEFKEWELGSDSTIRFYVRIPCRNELGTIKRVEELAVAHEVPIDATLQTPAEDVAETDFVIITQRCKQSQVDQLSYSIGNEDWAKSLPLVMPLLRCASRIGPSSDTDLGASPTAPYTQQGKPMVLSVLQEEGAVRIPQGISEAATLMSILIKLVSDSRDNNKRTRKRLKRCQSIITLLENAAKVVDQDDSLRGEAGRVVFLDVRDAITDLVGIIKTYQAKGKFFKVFASSSFKRREEEAMAAIDRAVLLASFGMLSLNAGGVRPAAEGSHPFQTQRDGQEAISAAESEASNRRARRQRKLDQMEIPASEVLIFNDLLGEGGSGTVYVGDYLGRNVACKVLRIKHGLEQKEDGDEDEPSTGVESAKRQRKAFRRELDAMIRLRSPNTVHVYGKITSLRDRLVLVMELLGEDRRLWYDEMDPVFNGPRITQHGRAFDNQSSLERP